MHLPFTEREFFDLFGAYNRALWPIVALFWMVSAAATVQLMRGRRLASDLTALVGLQWAWTGIVYHALYFTRINPAAWLFAGVFLAQAVAMFWVSGSSGPSYRLHRTPRHVLAVAFMAYALLYPFLAVMNGHDVPRVPIFAVPCPLVLFTCGVLLAADRRPTRWLLVVPMAWSLIGGSAAILLGVIPDLALFAAAAVLAAYAVVPAGALRAARTGLRANTT